MKRRLAMLMLILAAATLAAQTAVKIYRVNIFNIRDQLEEIKEIAIAGEKIYFFTSMNYVYCYGTVDRKEIWRVPVKTIKGYKKYFGLYADKLGRVILIAQKPKGVSVFEFSNVGKLAAEHDFPELDWKAAKIQLLNGNIVCGGKIIGELKTKLVFLQEERTKLADSLVKTGKLKKVSSKEWVVPVSLDIGGAVQKKFDLTMKFNEPTIMNIRPIRVDNYNRVYFNKIYARDFREDEEHEGSSLGIMKNSVLVCDLNGKVLHEMEPIDALTSLITVDDDGKVCEAYKMIDVDTKKKISRVYYWYLRHNPN